MTKAQWAALYDYCEEFGYTTREVLKELKANGTVDKSAKLGDLGNYVTKNDYETMMQFLGANL